jgi:hypothetical protein
MVGVGQYLQNLKPPRDLGGGYKDPHLDLLLRSHLDHTV